LRPEPADPDEMVILVVDSSDRITGAYLRMTEPRVRLDDSFVVLGDRCHSPTGGKRG
jgi:hypothetical protein